MSALTVAKTIKLIADIAQAAISIEASNAYSRWKEEVSAKLDEILSNTEFIIQDLQQLRLDFRADLSAAFATEYRNQLQAELLNLAAILSSLTDGKPLHDLDRARVTEAVERIRTLTYSGALYGAAIAPLALASMSALLPAMQIAGLSATEVLHTRAQLADVVIRPLLDQQRTGSVAYAMKAAHDGLTALNRRLDLAEGPVTLGLGLINPEFQGHNAFISTLYDIEQYVCTISGNREEPDGYSGSKIEVRILEEDVPPFRVNILGNPPHSQSINPPLDESGSKAHNRTVAEAVKSSLVDGARKLARERGDEIRRIKSLESVRDLAQSLLLPPIQPSQAGVASPS